jgi:hypothetical protein
MFTAIKIFMLSKVDYILIRHSPFKIKFRVGTQQGGVVVNDGKRGFFL